MFFNIARTISPSKRVRKSISFIQGTHLESENANPASCLAVSQLKLENKSIYHPSTDKHIVDIYNEHLLKRAILFYFISINDIYFGNKIRIAKLWSNTEIKDCGIH